MKVNMNGMTFESDSSEPTAEQEKQLKLFLDAVERIEISKNSQPVPAIYPTYPPQTWPHWMSPFTYGTEAKP